MDNDSQKRVFRRQGESPRRKPPEAEPPAAEKPAPKKRPPAPPPQKQAVEKAVPKKPAPAKTAGAKSPPAKKPGAGKNGSAKAAAPKAAGKKPAQNLPRGAVSLQHADKHRAMLRRRRIFKRLRRWAALALAVVVLLVFFTGGYRQIAFSVAALGESAGITLRGGDGFPASFAAPGYIRAQGMSGSFALLAEKDLLVMSSSGRQLYQLQHGYVQPGLAAGNTRLCVYNRGGKEYLVANRTGLVEKRTAGEEIRFAAMSGGGALALCTAGRTQARVEVYTPTNLETPYYTWSPAGAVPLMAAFHGNRTLAVGCLVAQGGAMNTHIFILNTGRAAAGAQAAQITAEGMLPLQMHFLSSNRLLVVYDTAYAALYDTAGQELARYNYGSLQLRDVSVTGARIALLLGGEDMARLVLLDAKLAEIATTETDGGDTLKALVAPAAVFLLVGREVRAYSLQLEPLSSRLLQTGTNGLVYCGVPLVLTATGAEDLQPLQKPVLAQGSG